MTQGDEAMKFDCTVCGMCCSGWLPLLIAEIPTFASETPLAITLQAFASKDSARYEHAASIYGTAPTNDGQMVALWFRVTTYHPPSSPCSKLAGKLCSLHGTDKKPVRCAAMPMVSNQPPTSQTPHLRPQWPCSSPTAGAPAVVRNGRIIDAAAAADYQREQDGLTAEAATFRGLANRLASGGNSYRAALTAVARSGGFIILPLAYLLPYPGLPPVVEAQRQALHRALSAGHPSPYPARYREFLEALH